MARRRYALVVAPTTAIAQYLAERLGSRGFEVVRRTEFTAARSEIAREPLALLVTELKLGDYNGLHLTLAARERSPEIVAIVIGHADPVLEREAQRQGAQYLVWPFTDAALDEAVRAVGLEQPDGA